MIAVAVTVFEIKRLFVSESAQQPLVEAERDQHLGRPRTGVAMTSERPYRRSLPYEKSRQVIAENWAGPPAPPAAPPLAEEP